MLTVTWTVVIVSNVSCTHLIVTVYVFLVRLTADRIDDHKTLSLLHLPSESSTIMPPKSTGHRKQKRKQPQNPRVSFQRLAVLLLGTDQKTKANAKTRNKEQRKSMSER